MENDEQKNTNLIIKDNNSSTSVFKLEYEDQNVNENIEYQKWKKLMLKEYGNNSKQFKCNKDKILFYSSYNDCLNNNYYKCRCPVCNNYICYFCSFNGNNELTKCCIKRNILKPIFYHGPNFIESFEKVSLFILIPFINIYSIVFFFFNAFYNLIYFIKISQIGVLFKIKKLIFTIQIYLVNYPIYSNFVHILYTTLIVNVIPLPIKNFLSSATTGVIQ